MEDKRKYNNMESVLIAINKKYISLSETEVKRNNKVLDEVLNQIIKKLKQKDKTFKASYSTVFYGGSYYDGLRVGNPEEFDLDLLLTLPVFANPIIRNSNIPGFVHVQLQDYSKWSKQPEAANSPHISKMIDDYNYLLTTKVSAWFEGIVAKALNAFPQEDKWYIFQTSSGPFQGKSVKGGPAHTLKLNGTVDGKTVSIDVDLVPCFVFEGDKWPCSPYRPNGVPEKQTFFIVPKKPARDGSVDRYWRLSFQEQERELISRQQNLKPALKLMKKMRDVLNHKIIASYYIKTVFLWELDKTQQLWDNSLSYVFITMLKKYKNFLNQGKIPYFWNEDNNLLEKANPEAVKNIANRLQNKMDEIEDNLHDPFIIAKCLVSDSELQQLRTEVIISKKAAKQIQYQEILESILPAISRLSISSEVDAVRKTNDFVPIPVGHENIRAEKTEKCKDCISLHHSLNQVVQAATNMHDDITKMVNTVSNLSDKVEDLSKHVDELRMENQILKMHLKHHTNSSIY